MGQGADKIARSLVELQPTAIVELFLLYFNTVDQPEACIAFHGGAIYNREVTWQGIQYLPIPVETEGFEVNANGQMARPKIRVSNKDYFVTDLLLRYNDLQFSKIVRKRTFIKYLDDVNFDGGNPWGQADATAEVSNDTYVISQKTAENKNFVEFELTSPLDLENFELNNRLIMSRYCFWQYRGLGCRYNGPPVETEEEDRIIMASNFYENWGNLDAINSFEWKTGISYVSGQPAYIENKKIILNQFGNGLSEYAKIWYVSQIAHTSSGSNAPDGNSSYWLKDGCSKKLHSCRKRFQNSEYQNFQTGYYSLSYSQIDLTNRIADPTNNIAYYAALNGSGYVDNNYYNYINDGITGNASKVWRSDTTTGRVLLSFPTTKSGIKQINIFDDPSAYNTNNAKVLLYTGSSVLNTTVDITSIPAAGTIKTVTFTPTAANSILISGSGGTTATSLAEVEILTSGLGLYNTNFISDRVFKERDFSIAIWGQFSQGVPTTGKYNLFHCNQSGYQYSGINLYLDCNNKKVVCDYSIVSVSGAAPTQTIINKSSTGNYDDIFNKNIFCIGLTNSQDTTSPTGYANNYLYVYDIEGNAIITDVLLGRNESSNLSGQVFAFRDNRYTGKMSNALWFGVNQWESTRGIEYISPMAFGTTAIWTKAINTDEDKTYKWFTRNISSNSVIYDSATAFPRIYSEIPSDAFGTSIKQNLYAWWQMDVVGSAGNYYVDSNTGTLPLNISGLYLTSYETGYTKTVPQIYRAKQTPKTYLPFGGFPGTDKYGG
jgi:lambda family phage minor tail protein L